MKEQPCTEACKAVIDKVVGSYGELSPGNPCSFGFYNETNDKRVNFTSAVCHASMVYLANSETYDTMITSYPVVSEDEALWLIYFGFLKTKLYGNWSEHFHLMQTKDGKYYIKITDIGEFPANVLFNFCIASRQIIEQPVAIEKWAADVELGVHPAFAFACCRTESWGNIEHWPMYNTLDLERVVKCDPGNLTKPYKESSRYCYPTNKIWGSDKQDLRALKDKTTLEFWNEWKAKHEDLLLAS